MLRRIARALAMPAVLFLIVTLFYWKLTIARDYTWLDSPDFAYQVLPWYQFQAGEWHAGRIPLWDPYAWAGQSLIGQAQPGAAYPPNWLLFAAPLRNGWIRQRYLHWHWVLIHCLAAMFAYWLCRDLKRSRTASLAGALAWGVGGWMGSTEWPQMLNGAAWGPLVAIFLLRVLRLDSPARHAAMAGAALGAAFLSGHHQAPTFLALAAGGIWIYAFALYRGRMLGPLAAFASLVLLVGAMQILPAYEYGRLAVRWVGSSHDPVGWKEPVPYAVHSQFGLGPASLAGIVVPAIYRHANPYIGVMLAALALAGALLRARQREVRIMIGLAVGGLLFSLSGFTFFHGILYSLAPMVEKARNASFGILVFHLAAAVLAAYGIDAVLGRGAEAGTWVRRIALGLAGFAALLWATFAALRMAGNLKFLDQDRVLLVPWLAVVTAALIYFGWRGKIPRGLAAASLAAVGLFEWSIGGSTFGWRHRATPDMLLPKLAADSDLAAYLLKQPGFPRVEVQTEDVPYTFGEWYGIDTFDAYTASMQANMFALQSEHKARMLMGMNFYLGRKPVRKNQVEVMTGSSGVKLWANPEAGPRAWAVHEAVRIPESRRPFAWEPTLQELRRRAFMTSPPPALESCEGDRVRMLERAPNRVTIEAEMECRGLVVSAEAFFPGWQARVDGVRTPIHEIYGALRGVEAGRGRHRIEFVYRPTTAIAGAIGTLLGLVVVALLALGRLPFTRRLRIA